MTLTIDEPLSLIDLPTEDTWSREVDMVISALEAGQHRDAVNRRGRVRVRYRVCATLRLFNDVAGLPGRKLFTRDVEPRSLGFVTRHRLPLGYGGQVELLGADGGTVQIACTVLRCRSAAPGWYEGAVGFNREQDTFGG